MPTSRRTRRGRRGRRGRRAERARPERPHADDTARHHDARDDEHDDDALVHDEAFGEDIPVKPYDPRTGRARRRRRPFAVLISLLVLAGLVVGIVVGGQKLLELIDPTSRDYTGQGTGDDPDPRPGRRHAQRHRPDAGRGRRHRLDRPVRRRRRGQRGRGRHPARRLRDAAADERPGGARPAAGPRGAAALPGDPARGADRRADPRPALRGDRHARSRSSRPPRRTRPRWGCRPTPTVCSRASSSRRRTTSSPTPPRPTSCGRWSPGPCRRRRAADPRGRAAHGADQGQPGAGRGRRAEDMAQGRPGAGEPARRRHAAAAGHHGELRQRQGRDHHHRARTGPTPRRTTPTCTPGCRRGRSATRARTRCGRCSHPTPATGGSSWSSTPTPATPASRPPAEEHEQNVLLFQQWLRENPEG